MIQLKKLFCALIFLSSTILISTAQNYQKLDSLLAKGKILEARSFFENYILNKEKPDDLYVNSLIKSGSIYHTLEDLSKADSMLLLAEQRMKAYPNDSILNGYFNLEKSNYYLKLRKMPEAISYSDKAALYYSKLDRKQLFYEINRIIINFRIGNLPEVEKHIKIAEVILNTNSSIVDINNAKVLFLKGNLSLMKGNNQEAEVYYNTVLKLHEEQINKENLDYGITKYSLSTLYLATGRYENANQIVKEAIEIIEKIIGKNNQYYAYCLAALGRSNYLKNNLDEAEPILLDAVDKFEKLVGKQHPDYGTMLGSLGNLYKKKKQFDKSERYFIQCQQILEQTIGKSNPNYFINLGNLAIIYSLTSQYPKSDSLFEIVMTDGVQFLGQNTTYASFQNIYAASLTEQGKFNKAFELFKIANKNQKKYINNYLSYLSEDERQDYFITVSDYFEAYNMLAIAHPTQEVLKELMEIRLYTKSILLNESKKIATAILKSEKQQIKDEYKSLSALKKQISKLYNLNPQQLAASKINLAELEVNAQKQEKSILESINTIGIEVKNPDVNTAFSNLQMAESAIEIIRLREHFHDDFTRKIIYNFLIVNKINDSLRFQLLTNEKGTSLETVQYENYYLDMKSLKANTQHTVSPFWENLEMPLAGKKHIYISPDGIYHKINFETLSTGDDKYLGEKHDFTLVSNLNEIAENKIESKSEHPLAILIGNPSYDIHHLNQYKLPANWTSDVVRSFELTPNPYTEKEVKSIRQILSKNKWATQLYVQSEAKEEVLKSLPQSPTVLHIATHGYYLPYGKSIENLHFNNPKNRLLQSMLFFSGALNTINGEKTGDEDGIFNAYDMSNLDLSQTSLVVLSACQTGLGKIMNGEGVFGLQRAVKSAGAKSLIISLWEVDDKATQLLMTNFYKYWTSGMDKHSAFKAAQKKVRENYPQPFYWGAFVLVGN
ncbi:MAG: CHAT domain-containing protein [Saprospiraceae bacterium]